MIDETKEGIAFTIEALERGDLRTWGSIAKLLIEVEEERFWQFEANSFTEWIKIRAQNCGYKERSLWRFLSAGRYYQLLSKEFAGFDSTCAPLEKLHEGVSPENLELLSKLSRVTPSDIWLRLAKQVVVGTVTRAELRKSWLTFRPVLKGRTARGRGVVPPKFNPLDQLQFNSLREAMVMEALSSSPPWWVGLDKPDLYKIFMHVQAESSGVPKPNIMFDAVVVVREWKASQLVLLGIEISGGIIGNPAVKDLLQERAPYCDLLWVAVDDAFGSDQLAKIPDFVGILIAYAGRITVKRSASPDPRLGSQSGNLAKGLLLRTLHR
jgi:hypothetical protein